MRLSGRQSSLLPYIVLLACVGFLFFDSTKIRGSTTAADLGPAFWPRAVLALLAVCALLRVLSIARSTQANTGKASASNGERQSAGRVAAVIALAAAYVWLSSKVGFAAATVAYLTAMAFVLGHRHRFVPVGVALLSTLCILYFFVRFVYVPLPLGEGVWETLTVDLFHALGLF